MLKFFTWWSEKSLTIFERAGATGSEAQVKVEATKSGGPATVLSKIYCRVCHRFRFDKARWLLWSQPSLLEITTTLFKFLLPETLLYFIVFMHIDIYAFIPIEFYAFNTWQKIHFRQSLDNRTCQSSRILFSFTHYLLGL